MNLHDIKHGLSNLHNFFSVIWNFRPWDAYYNLSILKRSLELTKTNMVGYEGCEKSQRQIQSCIDCIDRLVKDEYGGQEAIELENKWGKLELEKGQVFEDGSVEVKVFRANETAENQEELAKEERLLWELEAHRRNQDIETLFNTLKKFRNWWS